MLRSHQSLNFTQKTHNANETKKRGKFTHTFVSELQERRSGIRIMNHIAVFMEPFPFCHQEIHRQGLGARVK